MFQPRIADTTIKDVVEASLRLYVLKSDTGAHSETSFNIPMHAPNEHKLNIFLECVPTLHHAETIHRTPVQCHCSHFTSQGH